MDFEEKQQFDKVYSRKQNIAKYNKWCKEYISGVDLSKIEWKQFNYDELIKFYYQNYFDEDYNSFVIERDEDNNFLPFGMKYLTIKPIDTRQKYILGLSKNAGGTKTIVACIIYDPYYIIDFDSLTPVTYIKTVETNGFFQGQGVFNKMTCQLINFINKNQDVIITPESDMGYLIRVIDHIKNALINNGFKNEIHSEYELTEKYLQKLKKQ